MRKGFLMQQSKIQAIIQEIPKTELHVHLEGAIQPKTLLNLAEKHKIALPVQTIPEVKDWFTFKDFPDFLEKYLLISRCLQTVEDINLLARDFLERQAQQNIIYSEVTYTAYTHYKQKGIPISDQIDALMEANSWAEEKFGTSMQLIVDISREIDPEEGDYVASEVVLNHQKGIVALGLGGYEVGNPPKRFENAFHIAKEAGVPCILHAGETVGPESIWEAVRVADTERIGHGVRCIEDPDLVDYLREKQIPLEVCPVSNICLGVYPSISEHSIGQLVSEGLYVTINSDDPALFGTDLLYEFQVLEETFQFDLPTFMQFIENSINASFLPKRRKNVLLESVRAVQLSNKDA